MIFHPRDKIPAFVQRFLDTHALQIPVDHVLFMFSTLSEDKHEILLWYNILLDLDIPVENIRVSPNKVNLAAAVPDHIAAIMRLKYDIPTSYTDTKHTVTDWICIRESFTNPLDILGN